MDSKKSKNRHRRVECDVCNKQMRSDHLKRHRQVHNKHVLSVPDIKIKEEDQEIQDERKAVETVIENVLPLRQKRKSDEDIDNVRAKCLQNHQLYLEKIKIGEPVASMVESGEVMYESLDKTHRNAFKTYRKYLKSRMKTDNS